MALRNWTTIGDYKFFDEPPNFDSYHNRYIVIPESHPLASHHVETHIIRSSKLQQTSRPNIYFWKGYYLRPHNRWHQASVLRNFLVKSDDDKSLSDTLKRYELTHEWINDVDEDFKLDIIHNFVLPR